ncbi:MAG: hypothetical protein QF921_01160 [Pseudomonadales bacterium]|jgi:hypothetical protein|nr:hypothetical protein [Pseudomonadales bacterium]
MSLLKLFARSPRTLTVLAVALLFGLPGCSAEEQAKNDPAVALPAQKPDLNGLWQAVGTAHWNLEGGHAAKGPATIVLGAFGAIPAGHSYVEGGVIPYTQEAQVQREAYRGEWNRWDPAVKCFIPGIPRQTYMPLPFHIVQSDTKIFMAYEWGSNSRIVHLDRPGTTAELPSWLGYSLGHWEGDTLVVEVTDQVSDTWFDATGSWHSDQLKVTERYTPMGENHIEYEATIEDPQVFTRPWTIRLPLYRRVESNARLLEFKCVPFAEDAMYGHLRKGADSTQPTLKNLY